MLTNAICNLKCIIGTQPHVDLPSGEQTKNRFHYVLFRFLRAICSSRYPLVVALEDTQWADNDSIELLKILANDKSLSHFLLICTFRDDEVTDKTIFQTKQLIEISNLEFDDVNNMIADVLGRS